MSGPAKPLIIAELPRSPSERLRVTLDEQSGRRVDLRVTTAINAVSGVQAPSKVGVSIDVATVTALIQALQRAEAKARELGWIGGAS